MGTANVVGTLETVGSAVDSADRELRQKLAGQERGEALKCQQQINQKTDALNLLNRFKRTAVSKREDFSDARTKQQQNLQSLSQYDHDNPIVRKYRDGMKGTLESIGKYLAVASYIALIGAIDVKAGLYSTQIGFLDAEKKVHEGAASLLELRK